MTEHIKIRDIAPRVQYRTDGVQRRFVYPFPIFNAEDLQVFLDNGRIGNGFALSGVGADEGGTVLFDAAPEADRVLTLRRAVPVQRITDFLQGGELRADSFNDEFDYQAAICQQIDDMLGRTLHAPAYDRPALLELPARDARAARALVFDEHGNATAGAAGLVSIDRFLLPRGGALPRSFTDKMGDIVSIRDFGAAGDGLRDDTPAFTAALAVSQAVFVPQGTYRISATLRLGYGQTLFGIGESSVIQARPGAFDPVALPDYPSQFNAVELVHGYATVRDLRIVGGASGIKLYGRDGPCVKNVVENVSLWDCMIGLVLDGYRSPERPCYWNHVGRVLVARPQLHGVLLTVEGSGDTPNANKFHDVRVYSLGAPMTGCGFFVSAGRFNNSFIDCEANIHAAAEACFRLGFATDHNLIMNFYAECAGAVPGIRIDGGSANTAIVNLFAESTAGAPIWDTTDARKFTAVNSGFPTRNYLKESWITDLKLEGLTYDTEYVEPAAGGLVTPDLTSTTYFISAYGGAVEFRLPNAGSANGRIVRIKKTDGSANPVTVTESGGSGPDNRTVILANRYDFVTVMSNGANWWVQSCNQMPLNAGFIDQPGVATPSLQQQVYLVGAAAGAIEVQLPPPGAAHAVGRPVTVKKTDATANAVTVTQSGGGGPDGGAVVLGQQYAAVTVFSNGTAWHVIGRG